MLRISMICNAIGMMGSVQFIVARAFVGSTAMHLRKDKFLFFRCDWFIFLRSARPYYIYISEYKHKHSSQFGLHDLHLIIFHINAAYIHSSSQWYKRCSLASITLTQMYIRMFVRIYVAWRLGYRNDSLLSRLLDDVFCLLKITCTCVLTICK